MSLYQAEQLKEHGNAHFKRGEYDEAIARYSQAIQQNSNNPLLYTNRANARLKMKLWEDAMDDCMRSISLMAENMKAFYFLGQAQLELHHPNEALSSALMAYDLCSKSSHQTSSAFAITGFVLKCKKAKWDLREKDRVRRRHDLLGELESKLEEDKKREISSIEERKVTGELGSVAASEETEATTETTQQKIEELRNSFAISDPNHLEKREVPEYLVDDISFEIMHDPVVTRHGHSYERATIVEHLKRNPVDPLTREPLSVSDLRPNLALRKACDEFWNNNSGWAFDW
ncbi:U-box-domain-containing protein [Microthyrium microscopicum]|uniref:U-box-domain-containing protein n=1 Tax=Microthyrium microscopicum TaxID=703497 RepID=A0A6A6UQY8_9PEZI|nr:U-box-domain-containing protein [Microthyrium microscopicum]